MTNDYILQVITKIPYPSHCEPPQFGGEAAQRHILSPFKTVREIALGGPRKSIGAGEHRPRNTCTRRKCRCDGKMFLRIVLFTIYQASLLVTKQAQGNW
jgi:hypothetical protein